VRVKLLREPEIRQLLSLPEAIQAMEKCLADFSSGKAIVPGVVNLDLEDSQGEVHVKSAHLKGGRHYVIKIASGFYRNPVRGLPVGNGLMLLFEAETGLLECIMFDKGYITEMRTAAAGAVAAKYLAKKTLHKVGLVGSGSQARFQVRALLEVRWPKEVWVWSRSSDHVLAYIAEMSGLCPQVRFIRAKDCQDAVRASDLIITATPSRSPLVKASWLKAGVHITALGSDGPEKQELEVDVLARADLVFCDSTSQCAQLGEIHHGLEKKAISEDRITGEIGDIILGRKRGRETENQITIADLTGIGAQDAAAASLVFEKASLRNLGDSLEI
jgi:ornithine cyclodeaminase